MPKSTLWSWRPWTPGEVGGPGPAGEASDLKAKAGRPTLTPGVRWLCERPVWGQPFRSNLADCLFPQQITSVSIAAGLLPGRLFLLDSELGIGEEPLVRHGRHSPSSG